jgi:23S rRNA A2030 N6-methylase RlmJ
LGMRRVDAHKRFAHGMYLVWYPIIKSDKRSKVIFQRCLCE